MASSGEIGLQWTGSSDNVGVTGYAVYRAGVRLGEVSADALSYQDTSDVRPGTSYSYTVVAVDAAGNQSPPSNSVTVTTPGGTGPKTFSVGAAGDATIDATRASTSAGAGTDLVGDNNPVNDVVLKFTLATTGCTSLTSASLRLTSTANGSARGGDFYATGTSWSEATVTYANAPARGTPLGSFGAVSPSTTYRVDVTPGVQTLNGEVAFRVGSTSGDGVHYHAKEGATTGQQPQLTVVCTG